MDIKEIKLELLKEKLIESRNMIQFLQRFTLIELGAIGTLVTLGAKSVITHGTLFGLGLVVCVIFLYYFQVTGTHAVLRLEQELQELNHDLGTPLREMNLFFLRRIIKDARLGNIIGILIFAVLLAFHQFAT
jgi:ABC-type lipoprotein release transport system permease subunit